MEEDLFGSEEETYESDEVKIEKVLKAEKSKCVYQYDFGDSWEFDIVLEKIFPSELLAGKKVPALLKAQGPMLIEDCGGIWGFSEIAEAYEEKDYGFFEEMGYGDKKEVQGWLKKKFEPEWKKFKFRR